jgi:hypothetical protein
MTTTISRILILNWFRMWPKLNKEVIPYKLFDFCVNYCKF